MCIPLEFDSERERLYLSAGIKFEGRPLFLVMFVVDTGSPVTFIDEFDSAKARIFTKNLDYDHDALLSGTRMGMYRFGKRVEMRFRAEDGGFADFNFGRIMVAKTEWRRKEASYTPTSVLGLDFIKDIKMGCL